MWLEEMDTIKISEDSYLERALVGCHIDRTGGISWFLPFDGVVLDKDTSLCERGLPIQNHCIVLDAEARITHFARDIRTRENVDYVSDWVRGSAGAEVHLVGGVRW